MTTKTIISTRLWKGSQSWNAEIVTVIGGATFRATVKRDAYDKQSYGTAEVWIYTTGWTSVCSRTIGELPAEFVPAYANDEDAVSESMIASLDLLLDAATEIVLGGTS